MNKIQVPERKPSAWELQQKAKPNRKVIKSGFEHRNKWATPVEKQGMSAKKLDNNN